MRNGLGDRQAPVRAAAGKLIGTWVDVVGGGLVEFLQTFDLLGSGVAEDALFSVFVTRPDIFDNAKFDGELHAPCALPCLSEQRSIMFMLMGRHILERFDAGKGLSRARVCGALHKHEE